LDAELFFYDRRIDVSIKQLENLKQPFEQLVNGNGMKKVAYK